MSFDAIIRSCMLVYHCQNLRRGSGATKACIAACMARPWHSRQVQARSPAASAGPAAAGTARRRAAAAATPVGCTAACFEAQPPLPPASGRRPRGGQSSLHFAAWLVDEKQRGFLFTKQAVLFLFKLHGTTAPTGHPSGSKHDRVASSAGEEGEQAEWIFYTEEAGNWYCCR